MAVKEKESNKLKDQLENQLTDSKSLKQQMQEILQDNIGFKVKLEEHRDKLEMLVVENATLKEKIQALEDDCKRAKN